MDPDPVVAKLLCTENVAGKTTGRSSHRTSMKAGGEERRGGSRRPSSAAWDPLKWRVLVLFERIRAGINRSVRPLLMGARWRASRQGALAHHRPLHPHPPRRRAAEAQEEEKREERGTEVETRQRPLPRRKPAASEYCAGQASGPAR